ncbi:DUF2776 family protein [Shigella flexneri]
MHISILAGIPEEFKVNIYIGWLFKLIPLIMGLICIALGGFVLESSGQSDVFVGGSCADFSGGHMPGIIHYRIIIISQLTAALIRFTIHCSPLSAMRGQLSP